MPNPLVRATYYRNAYFMIIREKSNSDFFLLTRAVYYLKCLLGLCRLQSSRKCSPMSAEQQLDLFRLLPAD